MRSGSGLHALILVGLAASVAPSIGARTPAHGLILTGSITEGDVPNRFSESVDLENGFKKRTQQMGDSEAQFGFDGLPWEEVNDILLETNLPSAAAIKRAEAWLDSHAWRERAAGNQRPRRVIRPGASPIELGFDPTTGLLRQATIDGDWGPLAFTYSDWRRVGPFTYPFHREQVTPVGERTIIQVERASAVSSMPKVSLRRPLARSHAELAGNVSTSIPFIAIGGSHILVDAAINDKPARLIFDTGAANYLTTEAAPRFGVQPTGGINLSGVGESSAAGGYAAVDRIALGGAALRKETVVVGPSFFPHDEGKPAVADGLTGFEFLAEYVTTIDYPAQRLRFAANLPGKARALRVPFYNDEFHIYVKAKLNGVDGLFGLDTGDGGTVTIFPAFASRFGVNGAVGLVANKGGGVGGGVKAQSGVLNRFSLGGLNFDQLPVTFSHNKTGGFASKSIAGNLGGGILQCFRITINFPRHLLLLEPAPESSHCTPGGTVRRA